MIHSYFYIRLQPASPEVLSPFILSLTPSPEAVTDASSLSATLADPAAFAPAVAGILSAGGPEQLAAAFSTIIAQGQSRELATVINQACYIDTSACAGRASQDVVDAVALAVNDQLTRGNTQSAGQAIWWSFSGTGSAALSVAVSDRLVELLETIGCNPPLSQAFINVGLTGIQGGQPDPAYVATVADWASQYPQLAECFAAVSPIAANLLQQAGVAQG